MQHFLSIVKKLLRLFGIHILNRKVFFKSANLAYLDFDKSLIDGTLLPDDDVVSLQIREINSENKFKKHFSSNKDVFYARKTLETKLATKNKDKNEIFNYVGYDELEKQVVRFYSNFDHALTVDGIPTPNFRELSLSSATWLSCRMRGVIHSLSFLAEKYGVSFETKEIYISEQVTPFYTYLKKRIPNTTGSEFVSEKAAPGSINKDGIRHEDIQRLSFEKNTIDLAISMEVLEHVPDYMSAFRSIYDCLNTGGLFVFTVPFDKNIYEHTVMAEMNDSGEINYIKNPPEYHGDPMRPHEGALCYRYFGWKILEELKEVGFTEASSLFMYSYYHGIIGNQDLIVLFARK